ncbi:hypothetical protein INT48_008403 [Thamnidium elegans]|uniref:Zn(2)-C6 fungal-type domain-containing protein n=1 Tax=Thamnidium elegans TaxID=101142 RepID=A0A8H7VVW4_9FUNG|nr:hypothetical protein INT48_008403 [Thamnidium elegans]
MATVRKGKTVPCEGCRERKKKCSAGQPCERCKRLGIQCYYLKPVSPPKIEYLDSIQNQQVQLHVEVLEDIIRTMEREMYLLKSPLLIKHDSAYADDDFDTTVSRSIQPTTATPANWQLTLKQGRFSIHTDIQSYTSLLKHIETLGTQSLYPIIKQPTLASLSAGGGYLHRHVLSSILRKGNYQAPKVISQQNNLALQLIDAYFSCRFLHRVIFHQKTFYDLFVDRRADPESSPVVCALSAAVLTMHCKHALSIVPYTEHMALAEYYFQKSRTAVSKQFDQVSMETMVAYLHMSLYKVNLLRPQEANMYLEMAIRIRQILAEDTYRLEPVYTTTKRTLKSKIQSRYMREYETFKRLHAGFQDAVQFIQFVNNQRGVPVKQPKHKLCNKENTTFQKLFQSICAELYDPKPMPDESKQTIRAIMKEHYIGCMVKVVGPYFSRVRFGLDDMVPLSFLLKTEEDLKQVYYHQIPLNYRLAPSIFEDGLDDTEFKHRLQEDGRCDVVSVTLAARFYQSLLALHEPFLPVIKRHPTIMDLSMLQERTEPVETTRQKKQKKKVRESQSPALASLSSSNTLSSSSSDDTDDDDTVLSVHALRAQEVCHKCSITVVRLLEYQCTTLQACTIPVPSLLCAWDILMRNACLGMTAVDLQESDASNYLTERDVQLAREYAVRCIEILRRGYIFNGAERGIWEYYEKIEKQLLNALDVSMLSTVKYWEPPY